MIDLTNILVIARKNIKDALKNRWFLLFSLVFGGLALALSMLSQPEIEGAGLAGYNRTIASLVNLVLLFVPLIGLTFGATSLANERETGALYYLLAQPVTPLEVLLGKYLGMVTALLASLALGFGAAGVVLALNGSGAVGGYALTILFAAILGAAMLSLGFLISALTHKVATALGAALFLWLMLVFVGDLGLIGTAVVTDMPLSTLLLTALLNPLQVFKMGAIFSADASLDVLGPAGLYATDTFAGIFLPLLLVILLLWVLVPLLGSLLVFTREV